MLFLLIASSSWLLATLFEIGIAKFQKFAAGAKRRRAWRQIVSWLKTTAISISVALAYIAILIMLGVSQPPKPYSGPMKTIESRCFQDAQHADGSMTVVGVRYIMTVPADDPRPSIMYGNSEQGCIDMAPEGYRLDTGVYLLIGD